MPVGLTTLLPFPFPWSVVPLDQGVGGALWSPGDASCRPGGGGAAWQSWPRGPAIGRGVAPFPRPPLPRAGFSRRPSLGPLIPRPLSRGAGRWGVAVRVSGQWLAGWGAAGSPPRSLSPHSLPREVARPLASCCTVGGAWAGGPSPPRQLSRTRRLGLHLRRRLCGGLGLRLGRVVPAVAPVDEGAAQSLGEPVVGVRIRDA